MRLLPDGRVDRSFAASGIFSLTGLSGVTEVMSTADGHILALGRVLVRLDRRGSRDLSFGSGGVAVLPPSFAAQRFVVEPNSAIALLGTMTLEGGSTAVGIARLTPRGQPDPAFGVNGVALLAQSADPSGDPLTAVTAGGLALQGEGAIIATLRANATEQGARYTVPVSLVERVTPQGKVDPAFGVRGEAMVAGFGETVGAFDPLVTNGGTILLPIMQSGGTGVRQAPSIYSISSNGGTNDHSPELIPEFEPIGPLVALPDGGYLVVSDFYNISARALNVSYFAHDFQSYRENPLIGFQEELTLPPGASDPDSLIAVQPDGKLVLAGNSTAPRGQQASFVARLLGISQAIVGLPRQSVHLGLRSVRLRLTCSPAQSCRGRATLKSTREHHHAILGRGTFAIPAGGSALVVIGLTPSGRRHLAGHKQARVSLTLAPAHGPVRRAVIYLHRRR